MKNINNSLLVTGGSGFIGSNFIQNFFKANGSLIDFRVINLDKNSYASSPVFLKSLENDPRYVFKQGDISDRDFIGHILNSFSPAFIINFAAETHVDTSIIDPSTFIDNNIIGTHNLLAETLLYFRTLPVSKKNTFRFLQISTDEVFGSLEENDSPFTEISPYAPNNPYASSKASADHFVKTYFRTYLLPTLVINCSNNYGPNQFVEKLIPLCISSALKGLVIPIYGDGLQIRDWLHVDDHCLAINKVLKDGIVGESYNVGSSNEKTNLQLVELICEILDTLKPRIDGLSYKTQIKFIGDRPGHDRRYAIDASKIKNKLKWQPMELFEAGIERTVKWYVDTYQLANI